jgi:hypothetical protein
MSDEQVSQSAREQAAVRPVSSFVASPDASGLQAFPGTNAPGEQFEVRNVADSEDWKPDPSKSIKLSPARQALVDDIIALCGHRWLRPCKNSVTCRYSCKPTIERVKRYTSDCVYECAPGFGRPSSLLIAFQRPICIRQ